MALEHSKTVSRSSPYPFYTIEKSFEFMKKLYTTFGSSSFHTREEISEVLKVSVGYLTVPMSTAVQYGFLEMKTKIGYNPTTLFIKYYKPESNEELRKAQLECFKHSKLYTALLTQYSGNIVPTIDAIATTLFRKYGIAENASKKAAQIFVENLKFLNLISDDNKLINLDENNDLAENIEVIRLENEKFVASPSTQNFRQISTQHIDDYQVNITEDLSLGIKLKDGRKARLIYPQDIEDADWDKIIRVISAMKDE